MFSLPEKSKTVFFSYRSFTQKCWLSRGRGLYEKLVEGSSGYEMPLGGGFGRC